MEVVLVIFRVHHIVQKKEKKIKQISTIIFFRGGAWNIYIYELNNKKIDKVLLM